MCLLKDFYQAEILYRAVSRRIYFRIEEAECEFRRQCSNFELRLTKRDRPVSQNAPGKGER
jgi:hypothetical protein